VPRGPSFLDLIQARAEERQGLCLYTFLHAGGANEESLSYAQLDLRARALAARLQSAKAGGERVLLLYPPGLEFIVAFFACLYSGAVAVPAYPPRRNRTQERLRAIARDATPRVVLTSEKLLATASALIGEIPELAAAVWLTGGEESAATPEQREVHPAEWRRPELGSDSLAFLQYTSGSTALPKGVMVSHGNLLHNQEQIRRAFRQSADSVIVGWLPLYHDMGLVGNVLQPFYLGARCVLMPPLDFLRQPVRWLQAISSYGATTSGAPNFAYDLCAEKVGPRRDAGAVRRAVHGLWLPPWSVLSVLWAG
jgi:acyl-CoA synthetase (AMP-forming)/AMP-acid ligase II